MTPQVDVWPTIKPTLEASHCLPPDDLIVEDAHLITEDNTPVDNLYSERQMRLLAGTLYTTKWTDRKFLACANVAVFMVNDNPPIVPDVLVSTDVEPFPDLASKPGKSYFVWQKGKVPDLVIEIVSNQEGEELSSKRRIYGQQMHVPYYIVWDPFRFLKGETLTVLSISGATYQPLETAWFPLLGLGLKTWSGRFEETDSTWLRWVNGSGDFLPFGKEESERADAERQRAEAEHQRAEAEKLRREEAERRIAELTAKLHELGENPNSKSE
jgi:Uma2 family endonuclease